MNTVCLVGRLVRDPELRHTQSGVAVGNFTLAVDRAGDKNDDGTYEAGFFDVTCWNKQAEIAAQYLSKGRQVAVSGSLLHHKWESREGEKRSKVEVTNAYITFVGSRPDDEDGQERTRMEPATGAATSVGADDPFASASSGPDFDIPFRNSPLLDGEWDVPMTCGDGKQRSSSHLRMW